MVHARHGNRYWDVGIRPVTLFAGSLPSYYKVASEILWTETRVFADPGQRRWADFFAVVEARGEFDQPGRCNFR